MTVLLADTSAWHRRDHREIASAWRAQLTADELATCAPVRLEILYSARSASDYERLALELQSLIQVACGAGQFERALDVQRQLARRGALHHRSVKIPDLIVAAAAESAGAVLWHYDEDFDRIAEITGQTVEWVAPRGSL